MRCNRLIRIFPIILAFLEVFLLLFCGVLVRAENRPELLKPVSVPCEEPERPDLFEKDAADAVPKYTDEEARMLACVVQAELREGSLEQKRLIAEVVLNRVESGMFPDSILGVLTQKGQFSSIGNYYNTRYEPDEDTLSAVAAALGRTDDSAQGALYFYAPRYTGRETASWFENSLTFLFERREVVSGQVYLHRYFK